MGQSLEFHAAQRLSSSVNSTAEESLPLLSNDGSRLFFARALYPGNIGGKFSGMDVWYAENAGGKWDRTSNDFPGNINDQGHNVLVGMSRDGKKKYYFSVHSNEKIQGVYTITDAGRRTFVRIPGIDNQQFVGGYVSPDFDVMILSMKTSDSRGEEDLYYSVRSSTGQWSAPKNMGATINTNGFEISPFLSDDKKRLYFASNGHGGEGGADIFYSERLYNSWETWSIPVNLGKEVNSNKFDAYFSIYGDSVAYFASNRDGKYADLYWVRASRPRTVLTQGQRYLSREEWNRELGGPVSGVLDFAPQTSELNASQKELLFYIANKLQLRKDILFHLVVNEEESADHTTRRLEAITEHLVQSGISAERIITEQADVPRRSKQGRIEVRLVE